MSAFASREDLVVMSRETSERIAAALALAVGLITLGALSLAYGDLLVNWQPAPKGAAWRVPAGYLSGIVLVVAGVALAVPRTRRFGAVLGFAWVALWLLGLQVPAAIAAKGSVVGLLGLAEITTIAIGLGLLVARPDALRVRRFATMLFGLCAIEFGISHFVYADFTAKMVPGWLPEPLLIAWATGAVHLLTGLLLLVGVATRIAAMVEAAMMTSFVVLLHIPHVVAAPHDRFELTSLGIAWTLTSAAWIVAASQASRMRRR
jgi:uncharacterized membrane protein